MTTAIPPRAAMLKTYDATDNGDGTVTIHDLELVGAMKKGERGSKGNGRDWMERVIATHLAQLVSGYVAPAHDGHHGVFEKPPLGTFVPMRVRDVEYEGETLPVLFGDVTVEMSTLAEIQAGRWPYRSIEVDWDSDHITSLAFLSGAAPHWRFPILKSVRILNAQAATPVAPTLTEVAMSAVPPSKRADGFRDAPTHLRARSLARLAAFGEDDDDGEKPKSGDKPHAEPDGDEGGMPAEEPAPKWAASLMAICQKMLEAIVGKKPDSASDPVHDETPETSGDPIEAKEEEDEAEEPEEGEPKSKKEKAQMAATTTTLDAETKTKLDALTARVTSLESANTALSAENAKLKAENDAAKLSAKVADFVKAGESRLRSKRVAVPANFAESIAKLYAASEDAAETFVATLETSGRQDPPENLSAALSAGNAAADAPEFAAFVNGSTNPAATLEACRKVAIQFRQLKAQTPGTSTTLKDMLTAHFKTTKATA